MYEHQFRLAPRSQHRLFPPPQPNETTFNSLLKGFAAHDNVPGALSVLSLMRLSGVRPNYVTNNYLLGLYLRTHNVERATRLVDKMVTRDGKSLDVFQFNSLSMLFGHRWRCGCFAFLRRRHYRT
jgi:pentatricopeptide repeat protein